MNIIDRASSIIPQGETAIVLKTCGDELDINEDGTGRTGNWKFQPRGPRRIDKVIIFLDRAGSPESDVLMAEYGGFETPTRGGNYASPGRFVIRMSSIKQVGITRQIWKRFANAGTNPVRFLSNIIR